MFALNNVTAPMDAFPDPSHMNAFCPCYDKQALAVIFTSTRPFSVQEVATVMSGAKRAAADHGVSLSFYEDTTLDGSGLANFFVDLSLSKFHGTVITNIPSPKLPSTGPIQVSLSTYPNITVSPVSDGEEYLGSFKNILPYIGPNNTMTGIEAAKRVIMQDGWTNLVLCINPFQGLYAKYDAICVGAASAVPTGSGRIEVFTAFNVDQVATARASLLERINQEPYPTAIIAPESTISDILFGSGSADLTAEIQRKNISVVAVGISENAVAAMKRGIVAHIIDNGEYLQGYLAVVQAYLFSLQRARLANSVILSGPTVYSRSTLDASGHLDAFYAHAAAHIAGFETTHANGYTFTVATHASAASAFWAGMRSGSQWSAVNTNSTVIEMVTLSTDAATQAAFIRNVSIHNDPVKSDGWTVSLSRWAAFVPQLIEADKRNIPIVGVNTWGNYDVTSTNLSRIMAFVAFDEYTAMHQLTKFLLGKNPGATQGICMDENAEDPTTASCAAFVDIAKEKGINFTYLNLPENSAAATLLIDKALAWFPPSAKFVIVDRIGKCWIHASLRKAKFSIGTGGQAVVGTFDSDPCVVDAVQKGVVAVTVLQQNFLQGYIPTTLHRVYQLTGGYPFGNKPVKDPALPGVWPFLLTGPFFADASVLTPQYVNCSAAAISTSIPITPGPTNIRSFPFSSIAWPICDLRPRPDLSVPLATMPWTEPDAAAVAAACAVLTLLILAAFVVLLLRSSHPIIKSMSPAFVAVILVGMMAINLMALSWIGDWTVWKCHLETFVLPLAFSLVMGAAFIKNYRLHKIFSNSYIMKGELSNSDLAWAVVVVVTPNLVLAITWTLVSPKHPHLNFVNLNNSQQSSYFVCASDSPKTDAIFLILLYTYNALLVAATAWIAFVTRNVRAHLSEAAFIGYSVYNAVATCVVLIPLTLAEVVTDFRVLFWFRSVALLFPVAFAFAMLFGKRVLYDVWVRRDDDRPGGSLTSSSSYGVATAPSEREQKRMAIDVLQRAAALSTLSCTLCILHKTGFTASWKRKIAIYQVQTGCLNLFDEASLVVGQSLNMNFFALMRETSDESTESYSLGFTELNGGGVDEKLSLAFESGSVFQAWAGAFRTAGDAKKAE